jgi:hypothetical protein
MSEEASYESRVSDPAEQPLAEYRDGWACDRCGVVQYLHPDDEPYCPCVDNLEIATEDG